ncbi:hypothetical protein EON63_09790 [archaeon]|nr:MAG: hypothetical protein EON63_09790 [archaeon]
MDSFLDAMRECGEKLSKRRIKELFKAYADRIDSVQTWREFMMVKAFIHIIHTYFHTHLYTFIPIPIPKPIAGGEPPEETPRRPLPSVPLFVVLRGLYEGAPAAVPEERKNWGLDRTVQRAGQ